MAGFGLNIPVIQKVEPSEITLVDINPEAIMKAKHDYENKLILNTQNVHFHCQDISNWIQEDSKSYDGVIGIRVLS